MSTSKLKLIHCSNHKCLTIYYSMVMGQLCDDWFPKRGGYRHFNSHLDEFYGAIRSLRAASVNNHLPDFERLGDFRLTRFIRDPRDLVVSGYHYHRRGAEDWCNIVNPTAADWAVVNGRIPDGMPEGHSFSSYLQSLPQEEGLMAEIEFRQHHFDALAGWPDSHPNVLTLRYEDILGREVEAFGQMFRFYRLSRLERTVGRFLTWRYSARRQRGIGHIRNPEAAQWKKHFTDRVRDLFDRKHGGLVERLGYLP